MHEYSLVQALMHRVAREAESRGAVAVHRLSVRIGSLAGVDPELFASAYSLWREGTLCADAELVIEPVEARWTCPRCGQGMQPGAVLRCPECGVPAQLSAGDEIILDRIEMEVP
jgi:hydrogenase nickel insertion protein HypA